MNDEFYTVEACEELVAAIHNAQDSIKYLLNTPQSFEDSKLLTAELLEAYENIATACGELIQSYNYYIKAENWKCANPEEMLAHVKAYNAK